MQQDKLYSKDFGDTVVGYSTLGVQGFRLTCKGYYLDSLQSSSQQQLPRTTATLGCTVENIPDVSGAYTYLLQHVYMYSEMLGKGLV